MKVDEELSQNYHRATVISQLYRVTLVVRYKLNQAEQNIEIK